MKHKVLLVLLLGIIISVSASAQKVTMNLKQVKLEKVFSAITQQTGLTVAYSRTIVNPDRIVTVEAKNQELSKVLNDLFLGTNVNYEIGKTKIYLKEKVTASEQQTSNTNKRNISGRVVDEKGEPIIGASVMVKGAKTGTITDLDGNFSVQGKAGQTLSISYVGYTPLDVKITKLQNNRFVLKENTEVLDEVVVVGMDTQKRNTITAAVSVVKGDDIVNRPITDLTSALQGNVAGLNFASDAMGGAKGGELGTDIKFNIRGVGSINGGEPYVLVDGIEQSMQNVNPADVASISVLKDVSAAAIYGARAAYGVVLVTTKSGNSEKAKVSYSGTVGFSSPIRTPQMMNSLEFAYYNNALYDAGASASGINRISDSVIEKIKGFMQNPYSEEFPGIDVSSNGEDWASAYYA